MPELAHKKTTDIDSLRESSWGASNGIICANGPFWLDATVVLQLVQIITLLFQWTLKIEMSRYNSKLCLKHQAEQDGEKEVSQVWVYSVEYFHPEFEFSRSKLNFSGHSSWAGQFENIFLRSSWVVSSIMQYFIYFISRTLLWYQCRARDRSVPNEDA